jgi:NTP pyrophosphatase (non-canonical NTP hydrolase)
MDRTELAKRCFEKWGEEPQLFMAIEEMGELATAISHYRRGRVTKEAVCEEVADVLIMMEQIGYLFGQDKVDEIYKKKVERTIGRLLSTEKYDGFYQNPLPWNSEPRLTVDETLDY